MIYNKTTNIFRHLINSRELIYLMKILPKEMGLNFILLIYHEVGFLSEWLEINLRR